MFSAAAQTSAGTSLRNGARPMQRQFVGVFGVPQPVQAQRVLDWINDGLWNDAFPISGEAPWAASSPIAAWDDEVATT